MRRQHAILGGCLAVILLAAIVLILFQPDAQEISTQQGDEALSQKADEPRAEAPPAVREIVARPEMTPRPAATESQPARPWRLYGVVSQAGSDAVIPDARIALYFDESPEFVSPVAETRTDGQGRYEILLDGGNLPQDGAAISARAEDYAASISNLPQMVGGGEPREIRRDFVLDPGGEITGRVVDPEGRPIAGASVGQFREVSFTGLRTDNPNETFPVVETAGDGTFELAGLAVGEPLTVIARKDGYLPAMAQNRRAGDTGVEIVLRPGEAAVHGRVFDADGSPAAGVPVKSIHMNDGPNPDFTYSRQPPNLHEQFTTTDEEGRYSFPTLEAGWQLVIAGIGRPAGRSTGNQVLLEPGDDKGVNLRFKPPIQISGMVVDEETGAPVAGVPVGKAAQSRDGEAVAPPASPVLSDREGRFQISIDHVVEMELFSYPATIAYQPPPPYAARQGEWITQRVRSESGERDEVRVELSRPGTVRGTVYQSDGQTPASGATVEVFSPNWLRGGGGMEALPDAATGSDGRFQISFWLEGQFRVTADSEDGFAADSLSFQDDSTVVETELVLQPTGSVSGTVTKGSGEPAPRMPLRSMVRPRNAFPGGSTAYTDENGRYLFENVRSGTVTIQVEPAEGQPVANARTLQESFELEPGEAREGVDFQLQEGEAIEGVVLDQEGEPIAGATVAEEIPRRRGTWAQAGEQSVQTDSQGRFTLGNLDPGRGVYNLQADHPSYESKELEEVLLEDSPLEIVLDRRSRIVFSVYHQGEWISDFEYIISAAGQADFDRRALVQRTVVAQEEPITEPLDPGNYKVHVFAHDAGGERNGLYGHEEVDFAPGGEEEEVAISLDFSTTLEGTVVKADGEPLPDVSVQLERDDMLGGGNPWRGRRGGGRSTSTADDGTFRFDYVAAGTISLEASAENLIQENDVSLTVEPGVEIEPVSIRMVSAGGITGEVLRGEAEQNLVVLLLSNVRRQDLKAVEGNQFRFDGLEAGRYTVQLLTRNRVLLGEKDVDLELSEYEQVDFDLNGMIQIGGTVSRNGQENNVGRLHIELLPKSPEGDSAYIDVRGSGEYASMAMPGDYDVVVYSPGRNVRADAGLDITVSPSPPVQQINLPLRLHTVGAAVILDEGEEMRPGTFVYTHQNRQGVEYTSRFRWDRKLFEIDNQPNGRARAEFETEDGRRYVSDWTQIAPGSEKIITLLPEDYLDGV